MAPSEKHALVILLLALSTISVVEFSLLAPKTMNASAVETSGNLGIYWDANATLRVYSIDWEALSPGRAKSHIVYVRNEGNKSAVLVLTPANWNPLNASAHLSFSWTAERYRIEAGQIVKVTQTLAASPLIEGIKNFSFDIIFETRDFFLGDVNMDGVVNVCDIVIVTSTYSLTSRNLGWTPAADLNGDGIINILDLVLVLADFAKT